VTFFELLMETSCKSQSVVPVYVCICTQPGYDAGEQDRLPKF
jgi:hypothetical protein